MRKMFLVSGLLLCSTYIMAQSDTTMTKFVDSVCTCLGKVNLDEIKSSVDAEAAVTNCFLKGNMNMLMQIAAERNVSITDQEAMNKIGEEVGLELFKRNCESFMQLSMKIAAEEGKVTAVLSKTSGTFSAVETKEFNKFILTESTGKKSSYYWLHHFKNSEKFVGQPAKFIGKKIRITWQETEVYIPAARGYFKIKEIKEIEVL